MSKLIQDIVKTMLFIIFFTPSVFAQNCTLSVSLGDNKSICNGSSITFTAVVTGSTGDLTYAWSPNIPTSLVASSAPITVSPTETTNYSITVTDAQGCMNSATVTVEVKAIPNLPYSVHFTDCGSTHPKAHSIPHEIGHNFVWYDNPNRTGTPIPSHFIEDGKTSLVDDNVFNHGTTVLNTSYYVFEIGQNGCLSDPKEVPITVYPLPQTSPDLISTQLFGCGNSLTVTADGHGNTVKWRTSFNSLAGETVFTGETFTTTQSQFGLWLVAVNEFGCYGAANGVTDFINGFNIIVNPIPPPPSVSNLNFCIAATPQPIYSNSAYRWYPVATGHFPTGTPALIPTDNPLTATYFISQVVDGCESTARSEMAVTVSPVPRAPEVTVVQPTCSVLTGAITVTNPLSGVLYSFNNDTTYQSENVKANLPNQSYLVVVKDKVSGCVSPPTNAFIDYAPTDLNVYTIKASQDTICKGETVKLSVLPACATCTYKWSTNQTAVSIFVTPSLSTDYTVTVTNIGCLTGVLKTLVVNPKPPKPVVSIVQPTCSTWGAITITNLPEGAFSKIEGANWVLGKTIYGNLQAGEYTIKIKLNDCESKAEVLLNTTFPTFDPLKCYKIVNKNSGKVLEVYANGLANNAPIVQNIFNNTNNQKWQFSTLPNGFLKMKAQNSNKYWACFSNESGANVHQFDYTAGGQKDWKIECLGGGVYRILHKFSGKYLSIENNSKNDRVRTEIRSWHFKESQKWQISEVGCSNTANLKSAEILTAKATAELQRVNITWYSNVGDKTDFYIVEKFNTKKEQFEDLKTLNNTHFDSEMHYFTQYDTQPTEGDNLYRLKTVFNDGSFQLSETLHVAFGNIEKIRFYPNPADSYVDVLLNEMPKGDVILTISNMSGFLLKTEKFGSVQAMRLGVSGFENGVYQLRVSQKGKRDFVHAVVIQK